MPPELPARPSAVGCLGGLFCRPDRQALRSYAESMETAARRLRYGNDRQDPLVALEAWSQGLVHGFHAIEWAAKARRPDLYDTSKSAFLKTYSQVEEHGTQLLQEYQEDRSRTLHRYKDRQAQERSASKTVQELSRLSDDFLPDEAALHYRDMLNNWQAQLAALRA